MTDSTFSVFDLSDHTWLATSERTWTADYRDAAHFNDALLAHDIGERERRPGASLHVMQRLAGRSDALPDE